MLWHEPLHDGDTVTRTGWARRVQALRVALLALSSALCAAACGGGSGAAPPAPIVVTPPATPPAVPPPVPAPSRRRAIWIGDSLAARGWRGATVAQTAGSFVVTTTGTGATATLSTTEPHGLLAGNYVQLFNVGDPAFAAVLNGAVVRVVSTPSATQFTIAAREGSAVMPDGDYSNGYAGQPWLVKSMMQGTDESWLHWLNPFIQGHFEVVANYAIGGSRSSAGIALIPRINQGPRAEVAFIQYCTNDVNAAAPPLIADCLANVEQLVDAVIALGMVAVVSTPLALGDRGAQPADPASTDKATALRAIRDGLQALAIRRPAMVLLDTWTSSVDASDGEGRFRADYAPIDGIHPSSFGESRIAQAVVAQLTGVISQRDLLTNSTADDRTLDPAAANLVQNGMLRGTAGSTASTAENRVDGAAPTGWSVRGVGGSSLQPLALRITSADALDIEVLSAAAGQGFEIGSNGAGGSSFDARLGVGEWHRCGFELRARSDLRDLQLHGQVFLNFGGGYTTSIYFMSPTAPLYANGMSLAAGGTMQYLSQPFHLPQRPVSGAYLFIVGRLSGAATDHRFSVGRATCRVVEDPYA